MEHSVAEACERRGVGKKPAQFFSFCKIDD